VQHELGNFVINVYRNKVRLVGQLAATSGRTKQATPARDPTPDGSAAPLSLVAVSNNKAAIAAE